MYINIQFIFEIYEIHSNYQFVQDHIALRKFLNFQFNEQIIRIIQ